MKKTIKIVSLLAAMTLLLGSCEKNFDPKMYGKLFTTNFPQSEGDYESLLMNCYIPYQVRWSYNMSGASWQHPFYVAGDGHWLNFDSPSDYTAPAVVKGGSNDMTRGFSEANFDCAIYFTPGNNTSPTHYEKIRDITRMTGIIGTIEESKTLSDEKKKEFAGEAHFIRGLTMYLLMHMYGPVPVILDPALVGNPEAEKNLVRPTLQEMTEWITADMENGYQNMPENAVRGRYNKDYARFCLMRHYLNEGSYMTGYYDKAIQMYEELKATGKYSLYTTDGDGSYAYAEQFKQANKFNSEVIMAVSTSASADGGGKNGNFNPFSFYATPTDVSAYADAAKTIPTPFFYQPSSWSMSYNVSPAYYDTYEPGDVRRDVIMTSYVRKDDFKVVTRADVGVDWSGFIIWKYPIEGQYSFQPTDIPLARWADVLLMYAEATARKNNAVPTGEAMQAVNDVRARAHLGPLSGAAVATYEGFMDALLAERGHELLYEGCRKIDLIRFNKYRHNVKAIKGREPSHQYVPLPDYTIRQAESYGKQLEQFYERPDYSLDQ